MKGLLKTNYFLFLLVDTIIMVLYDGYMGYFGKLELQMEAVNLRKSGISIREIQKKLGVAKSSVSLWTKNVILTKTQIEALYINKRTGRLKGSYVATQNRINNKKTLISQIEGESKKEIGDLSDRDTFMLGIALYYGEGSKTSNHIAFTNSDPQAIQFMKDWFKKFCGVKREKIVCNLYLHDNLSEKKAKKYWKDLLDIEYKQFGKTYFVKNNPNRLRKTKHIYGVCRLTISDVNKLRKILGWIKAVFFV